MVSSGSESTTEQIARLREQVQAETVSSTVRSHPLPAVLIAALIGFVLGRVSP